MSDQSVAQLPLGRVLAIATIPAAARAPAGNSPAVDQVRLRGLFDEHYEFVWRSLRRLGVPVGAVDDGAQEVFLVASRRLADIRAGAERSFLFGTALRVASSVRRASARRREVQCEDGALGAIADPSPGPEELTDHRRARALLDDILDQMTVELRTVFVLFELEGMTMAEISSLLGLRQGTVASRLRRARELFERCAGRLRRKEAADV